MTCSDFLLLNVVSNAWMTNAWQFRSVIGGWTSSKHQGTFGFCHSCCFFLKSEEQQHNFYVLLPPPWKSSLSWLMSDPLAFRQDLMIDSCVIQIQQRLFSEVVAEFCRVTGYLPASQPASPKDSELLTDPCAELSKFGPDPNEDGEVIGDETRNIKGTRY